MLAKQEQFEYFIDDLIPLETTPGSTSTNISETAITFPSTSRNLGQLKFRIESARIKELKDNFSMVGTNTTANPNLKGKFDALLDQPAKQTLVGLAYQINAIEYEGLTDPNDHVKFTNMEPQGNDIKITLDSTVDMNHFIKDREVILSANTTSNSGGEFQFINIIEDGISPSDYKVCKVTDININNNIRTVTLTRSDTTLTNVGTFTNTNLQNTTDDYLVGFKNTFLIAKGRILV